MKYPKTCAYKHCLMPHSGKNFYLYPMVVWSTKYYPLYFCSPDCVIKYECQLNKCAYCQEFIHAQDHKEGVTTCQNYRDKYYCNSCWIFVPLTIPIDNRKVREIKIFAIKIQK